MRGYLYLFLASMCLALNFHVAKVMLREANFIVTGFWRYLFAVIVLFFFTLRNLPSLRDVKNKISSFLFIGSFCLFGANIFLYLSLTYGSAINAALILSLTPAITLVISTAYLKTPFRINYIVGILISLIGVFYLVTKGNLSDILQTKISKSDIFTFLACIFTAIYNVNVKKVDGSVSNKHFTLFTNFFCFLPYLITMFILEESFKLDYSYSFWYAAIALGGIGTALAYLLFNLGIESKGSTKASVFFNFIPVMTAFYGVFFNEKLYEFHYISGLVILLGLFVTNINIKTLKASIFHHS